MKPLERLDDAIKQFLALNILLRVQQSHTKLIENLAHFNSVFYDILWMLSLALLFEINDFDNYLERLMVSFIV